MIKEWQFLSGNGWKNSAIERVEETVEWWINQQLREEKKGSDQGTVLELP